MHGLQWPSIANFDIGGPVRCTSRKDKACMCLTKCSHMRWESCTAHTLQIWQCQHAIQRYMDCSGPPNIAHQLGRAGRFPSWDGRACACLLRRREPYQAGRRDTCSAALLLRQGKLKCSWPAQVPAGRAVRGRVPQAHQDVQRRPPPQDRAEVPAAGAWGHARQVPLNLAQVSSPHVPSSSGIVQWPDAYTHA